MGSPPPLHPIYALGSEAKDPEFLLLEDDGLDIGLPVRGVDTRSARFAAELVGNRQARIEEEMRILYVAVTRAQCAVVFVGSSLNRVNPQGSTWYSWRDELLRARAVLEAAGARFSGIDVRGGLAAPLLASHGCRNLLSSRLP